MSGPLRIGLVGCGRLAEAGYVPALSATDAARLVAVADPDPERRAIVAAGAGGAGSPVRTFPSAAHLIAGMPVDALVVASPAAAHLADATRAAQAGVAVLVEKPPAPDAPAAARLAALRPPPWIGFNRRFEPCVRALRASVPAGTELDIRISVAYRRRSWGAHTVRDDALLDLGPHLVDLARWLGGGQAVDVRTAQLCAERAALELTMTNGRAVLHAASDRLHAEVVEVRDTRGGLMGRHRTGGVVAAVAGRLRPPAAHPLVTSVAAQLEAFAGAVRGETTDLGTAADGVAVMATIDAARESAARGGAPVAVGHPVGR